MTADINGLVENLRKYCWQRIDEEGDQNDSETPYDAADALEAMAGEVADLGKIAREQNDFHVAAKMDLAEVTAERDRLKAALEEIKTMPARIRENSGTSLNNKILFEAQQFVANACAAIARKALGGDAS